MIVIFAIAIILIIVTFALKRQIDDLVKCYLVVKILKYILIALLVLFIAFLTLMGIGEIISGDFSGIAHLITAVPLLIIAYLIIKRKKNLK